MPAPSRPSRITIRNYDVGFGDCFLLTFHYGKAGAKGSFDRHVLIDFGSFPEKSVGGSSILNRVAKEIVADCKGSLDAVVATHRHADHINGFRTRKDGKGSGDLIASCKPKVVVQPWTEDPAAEIDAKSASKKLPPGHRAFAAGLRAMHAVAEHALAEAGRARGLLKVETGLGRVKVKELAFLGGDNLANASAVRNLISMGEARGSKAFYVSYGSKSGLEDVLPGVRTYVLGPPTLEQSDAIRNQAVSNPSEFWQLMAAAGGGGTRAGGPAPFGAEYVDPKANSHPHTRWLVPRLKSIRGEQLLEIVRELDKQMNNTSVILLFQTRTQKLLFPGDAQIENWSYALKQAENSARVKKLLEGVTFYKVGHHGSRNATPRTLWNLFLRKGPLGNKDRLHCMMSTEGGHHGSTLNKSEVPRSTLVEELEAHTEFLTTEKIADAGTKNVVTLPA